MNRTELMSEIVTTVVVYAALTMAGLAVLIAVGIGVLLALGLWESSRDPSEPLPRGKVVFFSLLWPAFVVYVISGEWRQHL